ncbi:MAG: ATP-binding protein [Fibromonadaceae bacterium]|nr:ATP-binding protein [Fibromonadaceae bacterium]
MSTEASTPLPIGVSFFDTMIEKGYYYVDKTLFIKDLLNKQAAVTLCTRPRRFGKTLNQTMLKCFFENTAELGGKDTRSLFKGLKIESAGEKYMEYQGKYPVIFLSFKEAKKNTFEESYEQLKRNIADEFKRHKYAAEKITDKNRRETFEKITYGEGSVDDYSTSIKSLSEHLEAYYGKKAIILIDEYDAVLESACEYGFYEKILDFILSLLGSALKDNPHLEFSVITGRLRICKIGTVQLNNLWHNSILSNFYQEHFYSENNSYQEYHNDNNIIRKLVDKADSEAKAELETLIAGGSISKQTYEDITYDEVEKNMNHLWNFLFFTGYLKKVGERSEGVKSFLDLSIPNLELQYIYETKIQEWFDENTSQRDLKTLFDAILGGNAELVQTELSKILAESISYHDSAENFYHGFMAGVLSRLKGYRVKSNRESGTGRSDLVLYGTSIRDKAVIFEFKIAKKAKEMPTESEAALLQIEKNNYVAYWDDMGYTDILKYGIAFYRKDCEVRKLPK